MIYFIKRYKKCINFISLINLQGFKNRKDLFNQFTIHKLLLLEWVNTNFSQAIF